MSDVQLIEAVKSGDMALVKQMVDSGAVINQQDEQGWTPLNWASGRGNLAMVKLLLDQGADPLKVGRDQRTPYKIALAAGHADVVRLLMDAEENVTGTKTEQSLRKYCKAYYLKDLRQFPGWTENTIDREDSKASTNGSGNGAEIASDDVVFIHQDLTVTQSMWENENVIFNQVTTEWSEFCKNVLDFKVPTDLDLIVPPQSKNE